MKKGVDYPGITVTFLCHDGEGNYLFQKRSQNCRDEKGRWDMGGGGLDLGDSVEGTLRKEIREEYLTEVLDFEFLGYRDVYRDNDGEKTHWLALDFRVLVDREPAGNGEPHKFDEVGWYRLDTTPSPLHSQLQGVLERYRDRL